MRRKAIGKRVIALALAGTMMFADGMTYGSMGMGTATVEAAEATAITSLAYFSDASGTQGPNIAQGEDGGFGFVMPVINGMSGAELDFPSVSADLQVLARPASGTENDFEDVSLEGGTYVYGTNWGWEQQNWGGWVVWFKPEESIVVRFISKTNADAVLEYTLNISSDESDSENPGGGSQETPVTTPITDLAYFSDEDGAQGPDILPGADGGFGFVMPVINGMSGVELDFDSVSADLQIQAMQETGTAGEWVDLSSEDSPLKWSETGEDGDWRWEAQQWGDAGTGWIVWFKNITEVTKIRFSSKTNPGEYLDYTLQYGAEPTSTAITSIAYGKDAEGNQEGPTLSGKGINSYTFGFVLPEFNGMSSKELPLTEVEDDLELLVKQANGTNGQWQDIKTVDAFKFNSNWAWEYQESWDGWVAWFQVSETTELRFRSKTNQNASLDYQLNFTKMEDIGLESIKISQEEILIKADGGTGIDKGLFTFNNDTSIKYDDIADYIDIYVKRNDEAEFVKLYDNAESGWIWDTNFGVYIDGENGGGWWFRSFESFTVRFCYKMDSTVYADVDMVWSLPDRDNNLLTYYTDANQTTPVSVFDVSNDPEAAVGLTLPLIGNTAPVEADISLFTYEVCVGATYDAVSKSWSGGTWTDIEDVASSGWGYQANGYNKYSANQQWGYWVENLDGKELWGLWFRPVKKDTYLRIGYPEDLSKPEEIGDNYVEYTFVGNADATHVNDPDMGDIEVDLSTGDPTDTGVTENEANQTTPDGWKLIWHDEFNGTALDTDRWSYETGYLLDKGDINTWGWGNEELQHYTENNAQVKDGSLKINLKPEEKTFTAPNGSVTAKYSSSKLISKDKFSVKYGRVDFRAKLPDGDGIWPAMWMMPNDDIYGTWACSGEIDIMEARGRTPDIAFGTLHFGGQWPDNRSGGNYMNLTQDGNVQSDITNWHVYSLIWEEGNIKIYADGKCYVKLTSEEWYTNAAGAGENAPFDQRFYLIMNLAAGGWFDNGVVPDADFEFADMYVDYVRVYQRETADGEDEKNDPAMMGCTGTDDGLYGDYKSKVLIGVDGISLDKSEATVKVGETFDLTAAIDPVNATNPVIEWSSSKEAVATVEDGIVTALKAGETTITVTVNEYSASCKVTVEQPVESVTLDYTEAVIDKGDTLELTATILPEDATNTNVTWISSEPDVAKVENGIVTAVEAGTAEIQVITEDGLHTATCNVTVIAHVETVTVSPDAYELFEGESVQLEATVLPENAANKTVTWESEDDTIATVSPSGLVEAVAVGGTTIVATAEDGDVKGICTITVTKKPDDYINVEEIILDKTTLELEVGTTDKITATVNPENATNPLVNWNSSNMDAVLVSQDGTVRAWDEGTATITATSAADSSIVATCEVTVTGKQVQSIVISPEMMKLEEGETGSFEVSVTPEDAVCPEINWKSSDPAIAKVDGNGTITALKEGVVYINATTADGRCKDQAVVIVSAKKAVAVTSVTLNKSATTLYVGGVETLTATVAPEEAANKGVTWVSENVSIVTVDANGTLVAKAAGTAKVHAITEDGGYEATCNVTVVAIPTQQVVKPVTYTVSFNSVGGTAVAPQTVTAGGKAVAPAAPTKAGYVFKGWYLNNAAYTFGTAVNQNIVLTAAWDVAVVKTTAIKVTGISKKIAAGKKVKLTATVSPANATNKAVIWTTSNKKYATVSATGVVKTKKAGKNKTVTITATAADGSGVSKSYKIKIMPKAVKKISLKAASTTVKAGKKVKIKAIVTPNLGAKKINKKLKWKSSNTKWATVTSKGVVKTKKAGKRKTVKITAMATDGSNKKKVIKIKIK